MQYLGIDYTVKNMPELDPSFVPFGVWAAAYLSEARRPFALAVEREDGKIHVHRSYLRGPEFAEANRRYVERLVKFLLWSVGGFRVTLCGCEEEARPLQADYAENGARAFDSGFMTDVYERPFEIVVTDEAHFPAEHETAVSAGGHLDGCRIGFDAGGSDRKVCDAALRRQAVYINGIRV